MDFPTGFLLTTKVRFQKVLVELFDVGIDPPVFTVDNNASEIGLGGRDVLACNMRVQHSAHHRVVTVSVEQIERLVAKNSLILVGHVDRYVQ